MEVAKEILRFRSEEESVVTDAEIERAAALIDEYAKICILKACEGTEKAADFAMVQAQGMKQTALTMRSYDIRAAQNAEKGIENMALASQLANIGKS